MEGGEVNPGKTLVRYWVVARKEFVVGVLGCLRVLAAGITYISRPL